LSPAALASSKEGSQVHVKEPSSTVVKAPKRVTRVFDHRTKRKSSSALLDCGFEFGALI
jgi:hypothetical protein